MAPNKADQPGIESADLRRRLQEIETLLLVVASADGVGNNARANLDTAIRSLRSVTGDLAAVMPGQREVPADSAFMDSRTREAKSEVDSGEFDMHG
jgi:hypothetical protein